jgi:starch-binding outer membrane protein, SusD/RagB family
MRIKSVFIIVLCTIVFFNCSEEVLEKPTPPGQQTDVTMYKSAEGLQYLLNLGYMGLSEYFDTEAHFPICHLTLGSIRSDDAWSGKGVVVFWETFDINNYLLFSDNVFVYGLYKSHYLSIRYCNVVIENAHFALKENPGDAEIINNLVAQARTLRALNYLYLARAYGDVVLILNSGIEKRPRDPVELVYEQVIKDLKKAIESNALKRRDELPAEELGQITIGTAHALFAKAYMYMAAEFPKEKQTYFQNAYDEAKIVIQSGEFQLYDNYADLWDFDSQFGSESIFEIGYPEPGENFLQHHWWASWMRPLYVYEPGTRNKMGTDSYRGWGHNTPTQDFVNAFEAGDPRLHWSVWFPGDSTAGLTEGDKLHEICFIASESGYYFRKTTPEHFIPSVKSFLGYKIYRYADLLLLGAEAANEIGETTDALKWLEMVRARARNTPAPFGHEQDKIEGVPKEITITDQQELRNIIRHERRVELGGEGERFYDLKRWHGTYGYDLEEIIESANKIPGPDYLKTNNENLSGQPRKPENTDMELPKHLLLPIPKREVDINNGIIEQNEGY